MGIRMAAFLSFYTLGCFSGFFLSSAVVNADTRNLIGSLPCKALVQYPPDEERVAFAVGNGIDYLRASQLRSGSWILGRKTISVEGADAQHCPTGIAALGGLTLLECGVKKDDQSVQQAARFVRANAGGLFRTYEVSLAALFLDQLNQPGDAGIVRTLCLRLMAGQSPFGGWGYNCPILSPASEKKLEETLRARTKGDGASAFASLTGKSVKEMKDNADNSNTQFAILALWRARKHDLPIDFTFSLIHERFARSQYPAGWSYHFPRGWSGKLSTSPTGAMTCVGLLGLAVGEGNALTVDDKKGKLGEKRRVDAIQHGLHSLGVFLNDPTDSNSLGASSSKALGPRELLNFYFLWSVERVGVLCNLDTIGGKDWYEWGKVLILKTQQKDGSWLGRGSGGFPVVDTCFALLFLKRSDLLPDLRETLQKRLLITDPGKDGKGITPKKSPGESPGEKKPASEKKDQAKEKSRLANPDLSPRQGDSVHACNFTPSQGLPHDCRFPGSNPRMLRAYAATTLPAHLPGRPPCAGSSPSRLLDVCLSPPPRRPNRRIDCMTA